MQRLDFPEIPHLPEFFLLHPWVITKYVHLLHRWDINGSVHLLHPWAINEYADLPHPWGINDMFTYCIPGASLNMFLSP